MNESTFSPENMLTNKRILLPSFGHQFHEQLSQILYFGLKENKKWSYVPAETRQYYKSHIKQAFPVEELKYMAD